MPLMEKVTSVAMGHRWPVTRKEYKFYFWIAKLGLVQEPELQGAASFLLLEPKPELDHNVLLNFALFFRD
jgi:hypothetical protein